MYSRTKELIRNPIDTDSMNSCPASDSRSCIKITYSAAFIAFCRIQNYCPSVFCSYGMHVLRRIFYIIHFSIIKIIFGLPAYSYCVMDSDGFRWIDTLILYILWFNFDFLIERFSSFGKTPSLSFYWIIRPGCATKYFISSTIISSIVILLEFAIFRSISICSFGALNSYT